MKDTKVPMIVGALLVVFGILFLLQNFGVFGSLEDLIWVVLFGAGGLAFLYVFVANRQQWWAVIPGFSLLGIAALIGLGDRLGMWGGALFLGAISLSFWVIYAVRRDFWWAVIPGGTLATLAVVAVSADYMEGVAVGGLFFLGLAVTFALVYLLPSPGERMKWALIPAGILGLMGLVMVLSVGGILNYILSAALIVLGIFLVLRTVMRRQ